MRAQHQTTMAVHVRKLNRGMKQSINNNKQNNKSRSSGAEFQKEFKEISINKIRDLETKILF
jgi:hypothetical protein